MGACRVDMVKNRDAVGPGMLRVETPFIEQWRRHYNGVRPHGASGYRPPAPV